MMWCLLISQLVTFTFWSESKFISGLRMPWFSFSIKSCHCHHESAMQQHLEQNFCTFWRELEVSSLESCHPWHWGCGDCLLPPAGWTSSLLWLPPSPSSLDIISLPHDLYLLTKTFLHLKTERGRTHRERERTFIWWFILPMATLSKNGSGRC